MSKKKETTETSKMAPDHSRSMVETKKRTFVEYLHKYGTNFSYIKSNRLFEGLSEDRLMEMYEDYMDFKGQFLNEFEEESIINKIEKITERIVLDKRVSSSESILYKALVTRDGKRKILSVTDLQTSDYRLPFLLKDYELRLKQQLSYVYELYSTLLERGRMEEEFFDDNLYYFVDSLKYRSIIDEKGQDVKSPGQKDVVDNETDDGPFYSKVDKLFPAKTEISKSKKGPSYKDLNDFESSLIKDNSIYEGGTGSKVMQDSTCNDDSSGKIVQTSTDNKETTEKKNVEENHKETMPFLPTETFLASPCKKASLHGLNPTNKEECKLSTLNSAVPAGGKCGNLDDGFAVLESMRSNPIDGSEKHGADENNPGLVAVGKSLDFFDGLEPQASHPEAKNTSLSPLPAIDSKTENGIEKIEPDPLSKKDTDHEPDFFDTTEAKVNISDLHDNRKIMLEEGGLYASSCGGVSLKTDILNKYNDYLEDLSKDYSGQSIKKIRLGNFAGESVKSMSNIESKGDTSENLNNTSDQDSLKTEFKEAGTKAEYGLDNAKSGFEFNVESTRKRHTNRVAILVRPTTATGANSSLNHSTEAINTGPILSGIPPAKNIQEAEDKTGSSAEDFISKYLQQSRF